VELTRIPGRYECDVMLFEEWLAPFKMVELERHYGRYEFQTWQKR